MKTLRLVLAVVILAFAFVLEFWFASIGVFINFILAALIAFAFLFDFWELFLFILLAVFAVNWQPTISLEIVLIAVMPILAYLFHRFSVWEAWIGNLSGIFLGTIIFYLVLEPRFLLSAPFFLDLFTSLVFGGAIFALLNRRETR